MRICDNCGAKNADSALFCAQCGHDKFRIPNEKDEKEKEAAWSNLLGTSMDYVPKPSGLFKNAGPKLKVLAKVIFVISLIIGEIIGIVSIAAGADSWNGGILITIGVILVIISPLLAWLSSIILYAFGELCDNVSDIRHYAAQMKQK